MAQPFIRELKAFVAPIPDTFGATELPVPRFLRVAAGEIARSNEPLGHLPVGDDIFSEVLARADGRHGRMHPYETFCVP